MIPALEIEELHLKIGGAPIVRGVSISVAPGEIVCLLGHSGCGKTTTLRAAAGLEKPEQGRVVIAGREASGPSVFIPPEVRGVGLMFQDYALFPHLTVEENVLFGLSKKSSAEARNIAHAELQRVGLAAYANSYPHMLSGGQQQRVALARALAPGPAVLLMDEPFSNLDQRTRETVREETMNVLRDNGAAALVVTHDAGEAMTIADSIALMDAGRIEQTGRPEDLYRRPASLFAARYFCNLNEVPGNSDGHVATSAAGRFLLPEKIEAGPCIVCIRPQAISLLISDAEQLTGVVLSRRFLGEVDLVSVDMEGLDTPLKVRLPAGHALAPGERVGVKIDPSGVLAFPKSATK